jgi:hypothetical protein
VGIFAGQSPRFLRQVRFADSKKERQGSRTPSFPAWNIGQRSRRDDLETHARELESALGRDQRRIAAGGMKSGHQFATGQTT